MKKILPLLILSVAAVLLLSSCDQMLEALFPAETGQLNKSDNTITFTVYGYENVTTYPPNGGYAAYGWWQYKNQYGIGPYSAGTSRPVYVELLDVTGNTVLQTQGGPWTGPDANYILTATFTFSSLADGAYRFRVWYDVDNDGTDYLEYNFYNTWYYQQYGSVNGGTVSSVGVNSGGTANVYVDLYEVTNP